MNSLNVSDISNIINLALSEDMFIQNLSNNNNWTGESINNILDTIKDYITNLGTINCYS